MFYALLFSKPGDKSDITERESLFISMLEMEF